MGDYMKPKSVRTPKNMIKGDIDVLVDKGEWSWSLCRLTWDGRPSMGIRWNGSLEDGSMGTPQSRGLPTWFIIPDEVAAVIQKAVDAGEFNEPEGPGKTE